MDDSEDIAQSQSGISNFVDASTDGCVLQDLIKIVRLKENKKRVTFRIPFILGEGVEFGVSGYNVVSETKPGNSTYLLAKTNEEIAVSSSYFCKVGSLRISLLT